MLPPEKSYWEVNTFPVITLHATKNTMLEATAVEKETIRETHDTKTEKHIVLATDGSSLNNPGAGGWCWYANENLWQAGGFKHVTNNAAELTAVLRALEAFEKINCSIEIRIDSQYSMDCLTKWIYGWKKNNWKTKDKKDVKNRELIEEIYALLAKRKNLTFVKVAAHQINGDALNNQADKKARKMSEKAKEGIVQEVGNITGMNLVG